MAGKLPEFDLMAFLPYRLSVAADRLSKGLASRYRAEFGISVPEWRVLVHLAHSGDVSVRDIETRVNMEKSKVSRAASRLEAAGYIRKEVDIGDRRLLRLALTVKGRALMSKLLALALDYQRQLETLLKDEMENLNIALDRILLEDK